MEATKNKNNLQPGNSDRMIKDYTTTITILENLSDAIFILNPDGYIDYANRVALDLLGLGLDEVIGQHLNQYLHGEIAVPENESTECFIDQIHQGLFHEIETGLQSETCVTPVLLNFGFVKDNSGRIKHIIASARDISIRKNLENELQQQHLLQLSRDRYRELGEMAVNMVHQLSQPLTSVRLMVEISLKALNGASDNREKIKKNLHKALGLIETLSGLISNTRNFAFLTEDQTLKRTSLLNVLNDTMQTLEYELTDHSLDVKLNHDQKLTQVLANPLNMQQVFTGIIRCLAREKDKAEKADDKTSANVQFINISLSNKNNRWIEINLSIDPSESVENLDYHPCKDQQLFLSGSLDLVIARLILASIGGDMKVFCTENGRRLFRLRLPVDQNEERAQLLNLIELMHSN